MTNRRKLNDLNFRFNRIREGLIIMSKMIHKPLVPLTKWVHIIEITIILSDERWINAMPMKLSTTIKKV